MAKKIVLSKFANDYLTATKRRAQRIADASLQKLELYIKIKDTKDISMRKQVAQEIILLIGDDEVPETIRYYISKFLLILKRVQEMDATTVTQEEDRRWKDEFRNLRNITKDFIEFYEGLHLNLALQSQALHEIVADNALGMKHYLDAHKSEMDLRRRIDDKARNGMGTLMQEIKRVHKRVNDMINTPPVNEKLDPALYYTREQKARDIASMTSNAYRFGAICLGILGVASAIAISSDNNAVSGISTLVALASVVIGFFGTLDKFSEVDMVKRGISLEWAAEQRERTSRDFDRMFPFL